MVVMAMTIETNNDFEDLEDLEPAEEIDSVLKPYYGFDHGFCDMLRSFTEDLKEIFELPDPEQSRCTQVRSRIME